MKRHTEDFMEIFTFDFFISFFFFFLIGIKISIFLNFFYISCCMKINSLNFINKTLCMNKYKHIE